jgi:hypothetical protein
MGACGELDLLGTTSPHSSYVANVLTPEALLLRRYHAAQDSSLGSRSCEAKIANVAQTFQQSPFLGRHHFEVGMKF